MVAVISGADNGSLFMPFGVLTFSRPFAILSFYRKQLYHQPMDITRCFHVVYKNFVRLNDMRTIDGNYEKRNKEFIDRLISILSNNKPAEL